MPEDPNIAAINLKEILSRICKRARLLGQLELRRACLLAAQAPLSDVSDADLDTLRAIGDGREAVDLLLDNARLARIANQLGKDAADQIHRDESARLERPAHRQTIVQVARDTFLTAAAQVVSSITKPRSEANSNVWFIGYCNWLLDGKHDVRPELLRAAEVLDTPDFREELLNRLWKECPEEAAELHLPRPGARRDQPWETPLPKPTGKPAEREKQPDKERATPATGEWSEPMSRAEFARRAYGGAKGKTRARDAQPLLRQYGFEQISRNLVRVRLDTMDAATRRRIEKPI